MEFSYPKPPQESSIEPEYPNYDPSLRSLSHLCTQIYLYEQGILNWSSLLTFFLLNNCRYQLIRVHPRNLGENCKWLEMFEDVDIVLFCVSLTDYDEFFEDNNGVLTNKMLASRQLFENIVTHPTFKEKDFLLLLNKYDILEEKIEQSPLTKCEWFLDFNPVISVNYHSSSRRNNNVPRAQYAFHYIALQFKRLFNSLTDRKLFVSQVTGLEQETVDEALRYAREILNWDEEEPNYTNNESSFEASSSS